MMSLETIHRLHDEATRKARRTRPAPAVLIDKDDPWGDLRRAPFAGEYKAQGWENLLAEDLPGEIQPFLWRDNANEPARALLFVDTTGWGQRGELALSIEQQKEVSKLLLDWSERERWYVGAYLIEVGQFQAVIRLVRRRRPRVAVVA